MTRSRLGILGCIALAGLILGADRAESGPPKPKKGEGAPLGSKTPASVTSRALAPYPLVVHHGAPFIELEVGGAKGLFLVDTGANVSGVDGAWLERTKATFKEAPGSSRVVGTSGSVTVTKVVFPRLDLGTGFFIDPVFNRQDFSRFSSPKEGPQIGLLGTDFLSCYQLAVDFGARTVEMRLAAERKPAPAGWKSLPVTYSPHPTVTVRIGPIEAPCRLDSGASYIDDKLFVDVNQPLVDALTAKGVKLKEIKKIRMAGIGGSESLPVLEGEDAPLKLTLGPAVLEGAVLVVHRNGTFAIPEPVALAGSPLFSRLGRFVLDPFDKLFWVKAGK